MRPPKRCIAAWPSTPALHCADRARRLTLAPAVRLIPAALLPHRDFLRFWWARLAGTAAGQMLMVAVGWQMYDLTGSAWDLGLVGLLQFLPALALVLVTGDVVDRHHRARVAAACVGAQAVVALLLA